MKKRTLKIYSYLKILLVVVFLMFLLHNFFTEKKSKKSRNKKICDSYKKENFRGIVDSAFYDYSNKRTFKILLEYDTESKMFPHSLIQYPERYLFKGDSIVKNKGESKYLIYKNANPDSLIVLEFDCSYWDKVKERK